MLSMIAQVSQPNKHGMNLSRLDWAITDAGYQALNYRRKVEWHMTCPIWWLHMPDPKKPGKEIPVHFNREDALLTFGDNLHSQNIPYRVELIRNPTTTLQDIMTDPKLDEITVTAPTHSSVSVPEAVVPAAPGATAEPVMVTIDEFSKADLRVGTILSAEPIPKANKLLRLMIDLGEPDARQILASVAKSFAPADLVGKQVVVVANLPPRTMYGLESRGMILAASITPEGSTESKATLVHPTALVANGTRVK